MCGKGSITYRNFVVQIFSYVPIIQYKFIVVSQKHFCHEIFETKINPNYGKTPHFNIVNVTIVYRHIYYFGVLQFWLHLPVPIQDFQVIC